MPIWKINSDRRLIAVRETSVSRHHGGKLRALLNPPVQYRTIVFRSLGGPLIRPPLCRDTPDSNCKVFEFVLGGCIHISPFYELGSLEKLYCENLIKENRAQKEEYLPQFCAPYWLRSCVPFEYVFGIICN